MGFSGNYEIVKRKVREIKTEYQKVAYMRFETEPGYQVQADFGEFQVEKADGTITNLYLFSMILGYSRKIYAGLIERCDPTAFLDCHINTFQFFGGVPEQILYDRMKNVYIGKVAGKAKFNDTLMGFALHYGFEPKVAPSYAAWVKGKIERPYAFIREGFWRAYGFLCIETANLDLHSWILRKDITSNKAFSGWAELFHDPAILDRLLHHSVVINIKGNSYRLKGRIIFNFLMGHAFYTQKHHLNPILSLDKWPCLVLTENKRRN